jgi:hypothetical protein
MNRSELHDLQQLVGQLIDGELSDEQFESLQFLLRDDPQARIAYLEFVDLHASLGQAAGKHSQAELVPFVTDVSNGPLPAASDALMLAGRDCRRWPEQKREAWWASSLAYTLGVALSACLVGLFVGRTYLSPPESSFAATTPSRTTRLSAVPSQPIATVTSGISPAFADRHLGVGGKVGPGLVRLERGVAELTLDGGAVLIVEGPCELDLKDKSLCHVLYGKVSAAVGPDTPEFSLRTRQVKLTGCRGELGLSVQLPSSTEVHVRNGMFVVNLAQGGELQRVSANGGDAYRIEQSGEIKRVANKSDEFVSCEDLARARLRSDRRAVDAWQLYSLRWFNDSSAILRYDFQKQEQSVVPNVIGGGRHAAISLQPSLRWIEGRWDGTQSLLFDGRTDVLQIADDERLQLTGEFTVAIWIRALSRPQQWARIVGKGQGTTRNYGLWFHPDGSLLWQVCPRKPIQHQVEWDRVSLNSNTVPLGEWVQVVGVLDRSTLRLYINGELQVVRPAPPDIATDNSPLTIGYYGNVPSHNAYFHGELGELLILNRAVDIDEVRDMYEVGRPRGGEPELIQVGSPVEDAAI